tara:strand:- start:13 stop:747 length:735 start_codon:yes stop_codon:yes gene_type:complete
MTNLSVNVNKIAWLRNARGEGKPSLLELSKILIECGVHGLTVHPRPDLRHITPEDVHNLAALCKEENIEFNVEGNPFSEPTKIYPGFINLIKEVEPDQCTLVPDLTHQLTSDHGWDFKSQDINLLRGIVKDIQTNKTRVSFFVDPVNSQIDSIAALDAKRIELFTGPYAINPSDEIIEAYKNAYHHARHLGLGVNAGHDLDLDNLELFLEQVPADEVSIGHALISDSLIFGLENVTKKYLDLCK